MHAQALPSNAVENNKRLFGPFSKKLAQNDPAVYTAFADKFAAWLSDERAYYLEARPEILRILLIAHATLRRNAGVDLHGPFHISSCITHPMVAPYSRLLRVINPHRHLFIEPPLYAQIKSLLQTITAPSHSRTCSVESAIPGPLSSGFSSQGNGRSATMQPSPSSVVSSLQMQHPSTHTYPYQKPLTITHSESPQPVHASGPSAWVGLPSNTTVNAFGTHTGAASVDFNQTTPVAVRSISPSIILSTHPPDVHIYHFPENAWLDTLHTSQSLEPLQGGPTAFSPIEANIPAKPNNTLPTPSAVPISSQQPLVAVRIKKKKRKLQVGLETLIEADLQELRQRGAIAPVVKEESVEVAGPLLVSIKSSEEAVAATVVYDSPVESIDVDAHTPGVSLHVELQKPVNSPESFHDTVTDSKTILMERPLPTTLPPPSQDTRQPSFDSELVISTPDISMVADAVYHQTSRVSNTEQSLLEIIPLPTEDIDMTNGTDRGSEKESREVESKMLEMAQRKDQASPSTSRHISEDPLPVVAGQDTQLGDYDYTVDHDMASTPPHSYAADTRMSVNDLTSVETQETTPSSDPLDTKDRLPRVILGTISEATKAAVLEETKITEPSPSHDFPPKYPTDMEVDHETYADVAQATPTSPIIQMMDSMNVGQPSEGFYGKPEARSQIVDPKAATSPIFDLLSAPETSVSSNLGNISELGSSTPQDQKRLTSSPQNISPSQISPMPQSDNWTNATTNLPTSVVFTSSLEFSEEDRKSIHAFGGEMRVLALQKGLSKKSKVKIRFEIPQEQYHTFDLWKNRRKNNHTIGLERSLCLTLSCYSRVTHKRETKTIEQINALPSVWPTGGGLSMSVWLKDKTTSFPLAPPFKVGPNGMIDVSEFLRIGENIIELVQQDDMSEYIFVLRAHYPTRAQIEQVKHRRQKDDDWKDWLHGILQPLDVPIPVFA